MPVGIGVAVVLAVCIVPSFVIVVSVPPKANVDIFNVPPVVVVSVPFTVMAPDAVFELLEFETVRLLYVPAITVCPPVERAYIKVPPHVFPVVTGVAEVFEVVKVPEFAAVNAPLKE